MKKVIINCISNCSLVGKYHISLFDKYNNKIFVGYTKYGIIELCLNKEVYKIIIIPLDMYSSMLSSSFIVNDNKNYYHFCLTRKNNSLKVTAILVDKNYGNLPIERGEIKLWQDRIR